ncbi:MAG: hypothetical protein N2380_06580 [bacterium]|nr:hypothetical protein [bacterium]
MKRVFILLLVLFILLSLSSGFADAKENSALNIGLTISERIGKDENGLVVLDGIFTTITFSRFPGVEDFSVYSRWVGSGLHSIKIQIIDNEGNIIIDTEDIEFNFEMPNIVYYYNIDFNNIVFTKSGVYWIEAILDNKRDFSIPLFIKLKGAELKVEGLPEIPVLILSVTATSIEKKENELPVISGVFENFMSKIFPFADDFIIANLWYSGNGTFTQYVEILDPDGKILYKSEPASFEHEPETLTILYDELEDIIFPKIGEYRVNVYLEENLVFSYPVLVLQK